MVLEGHRRSLDLFFDPLVKAFAFLGPDFFSYLSVIFAILAGIVIGFSGEWVPGGNPWMLLIGLLLVGFNSIADTMDGRVARYTGRETTAGDFLDHTFDRVSDVVILSGIALSPYSNTIFGLLAVVFVLLASYMGTQSQAVGCGRDYKGVMGRADRMVLLLFVIPVQFIIEAGWGIQGWRLLDLIGSNHVVTPLEMLLGAFLVGGAITAFTRGLSTYRELTGKARMEKERERPGSSRPKDGSVVGKDRFQWK